MRLLGVIAVLFSTQAFACPKLTGIYTCTYQDNSSETVTISQEWKNGVMTYNHNGSQIPADNMAYPVPDDANLHEATFRAWCVDGATLNTNLVGKYYQDGEYFGDLDLNSSFTLEGANLTQVTSGTLTNQGGRYPWSSELTCTLNP